MVFDPFTIIMLAVLAVLIFFMFRNSRKRQAEQREQQSKVVPGAKVMTNFGLYGTILSIDEDENQIQLEAAPGTVLTVHRQTVARVIDPVVAADDAVEADAAAVEGEPEFGERIDAPSNDETPDTKKSDD
ncbi:preprotein translocase subunit YajC [Agromyces sp. CFH 90414]|uniref:Preprotein translocase subunit YajC n=1 Tax=Agromyces agglutinans TaxID=2662258 RepID=A0A6I2F259_9MICO|nr:preprotein translocase subunit YajC [Agromyces agglutinans]MRG58572.1 preprotein translocase subunit YajC [Agromyces agglutinans]